MKKEKNYKIYVKNLVLNALVGIYPKEKIKKQRVRFNIVVTAKDNIKNNNVISDFVSYEDIISIIKKILKKGHISLIENLANQIAYECLKNKKVVLDITDYGASSSASSKFIEVAKKENIAFTTFRCNTWQDCGRIIPFSNKSEKQLEHQFTNCCNSDLISLLHGKLYRCPFSANGVNLNAIPQNKTDEVDLINDDLSIDETKKQIKQLCYDKKYLTACLYCNGRDYTSVDITSAIQTRRPLEISPNTELKANK